MVFSHISAIAALDIQTDLLAYAGQQAIAHAVLIFAILTAAFTFATGFKDKIRKKSASILYFIILAPLIFGSFWATVRLYFYGQMVQIVLNTPMTSSSETLTDYFKDVFRFQNSILNYTGGLNIQSPIVILCIIAAVIAAILVILLARIEDPSSDQQGSEGGDGSTTTTKPQVTKRRTHWLLFCVM